MSERDRTENADTAQEGARGVPTVSVIIPTLNGAGQVRELLAALTVQTAAPDQILVVDSSSDDDTVAVARAYGAETMVVARDAFDHGGTRSLAAEMAKGEILVFFTQDVLPADRSVLENLVKPLVADAAIAVSYGRQLPAFDANDIAAHLRRFNYPEASAVRSIADRDRLGLGTVFASNSCAAYRKDNLAGIGYFSTGLIFGEDTCAVARLLEKGFKIAYVAEAAVYHSHNYQWAEEFRRYFDIGVLHAEEKWLIDTYGGAEGRGAHYIRSGISYLYHRRRYGLIGDFMVRSALKYLGYRLGRNFQKLPRRLIPELSMHRRWWHGNQSSR